MRFGNPNEGLLAEILQVIKENGQTESYDSGDVMVRVAQSGFWKDRKPPKTPARTVNSYFSQNFELFENVGDNRYRLRLEKYQSPHSTATPLDAGVGVPPKAQTTHLRTVRETKFIRQLKLLHGNRCQICNVAVLIGNDAYSEGHHIRHLAEGGEDDPRNILILCPNHHVQCDYCAIPLEMTQFRVDSRHIVEQSNIDWHNAKYSETVRSQ